MSKESGCDPNAISPTNDHGLMQINWAAHHKQVNDDVSLLHDPETNIRLGALIYSYPGHWKSWYAVCPKNGSNPYGIC